MPFFCCRLNPPRASFIEDMTPDEAALMQRHGAYLAGLAEAGEVLVYGPVADPAGPWGLAVMEAADEATARRRLADDPVVASGRGFRYDVHPMLQAHLRPARAPDPA